MAQHDYVIANGSGSAVRSDLNNALAAIVSHNSGTSEPTTTYAYMPWADTSAGVMKLRNGANNAWITLYQLDGEYTTIPLENGTAAAPSLYFKTSGTDTGLYSPGTDQVAISTAGTGRLFVDSSGRVGVGTNSPNATLSVASGSTSLMAELNSTNANGGYFSLLTSGSVYGDIGTAAQCVSGSASDFCLNGRGSRSLVFGTNNTERLRITSDGKVGIGLAATSPASLLTSYAGNVSTLGAKTSTGLLIENNGNVGNISQIGLGYTFSSTYHPVAIAAVTNSGSGSSKADLVFAVRDATTDIAPTERLRISSDGQLSAVVPGGSTLYPGFMARAWVNFDGTGTVAIRASGNVSSITDNGTGDYTVNFTTAMVDANYSPAVIARRPDNLLDGSWFVQLQNTGAMTASALRLVTVYNPYTSPSIATDSTGVYVAIFR